MRGVTALCDLYKKGVLPKNSMNLKTEDVTTFMQQGRGAMTNNPFNRYLNYNDAEGERSIRARSRSSRCRSASTASRCRRRRRCGRWRFRGTRRTRTSAWSLISHLSPPESTVAETLNGNGPVRPSAYEDAKVKALIPYAAAEKQALGSARLVVPGFANSAKSMDIFIEELGNAMLGNKEPQAAMAEVKKRVTPLLPT